MRFSTLPAIAALAVLLPAAALASSDDAWVEFGKQVSAQCLKAVGKTVQKPAILIDPYGSDSFGIAIISGTSPGSDTKIGYVCIYNKQSKKTELGSELLMEVIKGKDQ